MAYLQRNLDVHVPMPRELMSSFGETNAALEGQRGHILVANHHEEGLLPRTAATAGHPLLDPTTSTTAASACIASPSCVAVGGGYEYKLFSLTYPLIAYSAFWRPGRPGRAKTRPHPPGMGLLARL